MPEKGEIVNDEVRLQQLRSSEVLDISTADAR